MAAATLGHACQFGPRRVDERGNPTFTAQSCHSRYRSHWNFTGLTPSFTVRRTPTMPSAPRASASSSMRFIASSRAWYSARVMSTISQPGWLGASCGTVGSIW